MKNDMKFEQQAAHRFGHYGMAPFFGPKIATEELREARVQEAKLMEKNAR